MSSCGNAAAGTLEKEISMGFTCINKGLKIFQCFCFICLNILVFKVMSAVSWHKFGVNNSNNNQTFQIIRGFKIF